jgi:cytidylate kinase
MMAAGARTPSREATTIITIDGPAGTGKSTVAHRLAQRLGLEFLDTGAMYRAAALIAIEGGLDPASGGALADAIERAGLHFDWSMSPPGVFLGEREVGRRIREADVAEIVSTVAAQPEVRAVLVAAQRRIAATHPGLVTEGRDQGSVVFPDASVRFYLDADPVIRAERRAAQLHRAGLAADPAIVQREIERRDRLDSARSDGPLIKPAGAIEVDTGVRTIDEVVDVLESEVRRAMRGRDR